MKWSILVCSSNRNVIVDSEEDCALTFSAASFASLCHSSSFNSASNLAFLDLFMIVFWGFIPFMLILEISVDICITELSLTQLFITNFTCRMMTNRAADEKLSELLKLHLSVPNMTKAMKTCPMLVYISFFVTENVTDWWEITVVSAEITSIFYDYLLL